MNDILELGKIKYMKSQDHNNINTKEKNINVDSNLLKINLNLFENKLKTPIKPYDNCINDLNPNINSLFATNDNNFRYIIRNNIVDNKDQYSRQVNMKLDYDLLQKKNEKMSNNRVRTGNYNYMNDLKNLDDNSRLNKTDDPHHSNSINNNNFTNVREHLGYINNFNYDHSLNLSNVEFNHNNNAFSIFQNLNHNYKDFRNLTKINFYKSKEKLFHDNNNFQKNFINKCDIEDFRNNNFNNKKFKLTLCNMDFDRESLLQKIKKDDNDSKSINKERDLDNYLDNQIKITKNKLKEYLNKTENIIIDNKAEIRSNTNYHDINDNIEKFRNELFIPDYSNYSRNMENFNEKIIFYKTQPHSNYGFKKYLDQQNKFNDIEYKLTHSCNGEHGRDQGDHYKYKKHKANIKQDSYSERYSNEKNPMNVENKAKVFNKKEVYKYKGNKSGVKQEKISNLHISKKEISSQSREIKEDSENDLKKLNKNNTFLKNVSENILFKNSLEQNFRNLNSKTLKLNKNDDKQNDYQTISNTNNTIIIMDSLKISDNSKHQEVNNLSKTNMNTCKIPENLRSIKEENFMKHDKENLKITINNKKKSNTNLDENNFKDKELDLQEQVNIDKLYKKELQTYQKFLELNNLITEKLTPKDKSSDISNIKTKEAVNGIAKNFEKKIRQGRNINKISFNNFQNYQSDQNEENNQPRNYKCIAKDINENETINLERLSSIKIGSEKNSFIGSTNEKLLKNKETDGNTIHFGDSISPIIGPKNRNINYKLKHDEFMSPIFKQNKNNNIDKNQLKFLKDDIDVENFKQLKTERLKKIQDFELLDSEKYKNKNIKQEGRNSKLKRQNHETNIFKERLYNDISNQEGNSFNTNLNSKNEINLRNNVNKNNEKIRDILNKIPEIVNKYKEKRENLKISNCHNFFNMKNLDMLIDINKFDSNENPNLLEKSIIKKNILDEADVIIDNHILKLKNQSELKNKNELSNKNYINNQFDNSKLMENRDNNITIKDETNKKKNDENLQCKINEIYDLLKNLTHTKFKNPNDLNFDEVEERAVFQNTTQKQSGFESSNIALKRSRQIDQLQLDNRLNQNHIFVDNKKISFEIQKHQNINNDSKINLNSNKIDIIKNDILIEKEINCKINNMDNINTQKDLLSPQSKDTLQDLFKTSKANVTNLNLNEKEIKEVILQKKGIIYDLENDNNNNKLSGDNNLDNTKISRSQDMDILIKSQNIKNINDKSNNKIVNNDSNDIPDTEMNPYEIIEKRYEKIIDPLILIKRPQVSVSIKNKKYIENEPKILSNSSTPMNSKALNISNNSYLDYQKLNASEFRNSVSKKISFSSSRYELDLNNTSNGYDESERKNQNNMDSNKKNKYTNNSGETKEKEELEEHNLYLKNENNDVADNEYSEDEPRSLDNCMKSYNNKNLNNIKTDDSVNTKLLISQEHNLESIFKNEQDANLLKKENFERDRYYKNQISQDGKKIDNQQKIDSIKFEYFLYSNSGKTKNSMKNQKIYLNDYSQQNNDKTNNNCSEIFKGIDTPEGEIKIDDFQNIKSLIDTCNSQRNNNRVNFSDKLIYIEYDDDSYAQDIKVLNENGKTEKHKKFNFLKYLIRIKNNKFKTKKILHYYYNGLRDDKLPKKLLSNLKRSNLFSEQDKVLGLKKLNEFLDECNKENQLHEMQELKKKKIIERDLKRFHEIEELQKKGKISKKIRSPTPKKIVHSHICKKFICDPNKFFTIKPPKNLIKIFNLNKSASSTEKNTKSSNKISDKSFNILLNGIKKYQGLVTNYENLNNKSTINNKQNKNLYKEFTLNSEPSTHREKEKALKNIISNINLEESLNPIEKESNNIKQTESSNDVQSLMTYEASDSPTRKKFIHQNQ